VATLKVFDDGGGPQLYVGGHFRNAGGKAVYHVASWDGASWSSVGSGLSHEVHALEVFNDGSGSDLYAGGRFSVHWGGNVNHIASWDGVTWSPVGGGINNTVHALAAYTDASGPAIYAGGMFTSAGGTQALRIARWNGTTWSPVASGIGGNWVNALAVFDDGSGPALYAAGRFFSAGGKSAANIAKWDGTKWSALGTGINGEVYALQAFDDGFGGGPVLYAGGLFSKAGGLSAKYIARWDGVSWSPVGLGTDNTVYSLGVLNQGDAIRRGLYVGGFFGTADGSPATRISRLRDASCEVDVNCDGVVNSLDVVGFLLGWRHSLHCLHDWNGDGVVDGGDVIAFLQAWAAGC
jgi:hypothetical protein